jgi:hypothetical protein
MEFSKNLVNGLYEMDLASEPPGATDFDVEKKNSYRHEDRVK